MVTQEYLLNEAAFRRMEGNIKERYPHGHFVAIAGGEIVGDAVDFMTLYHAQQAAGRDPRSVFIIQAGHEYLKEAVIYL